MTKISKKIKRKRSQRIWVRLDREEFRVIKRVSMKLWKKEKNKLKFWASKGNIYHLLGLHKNNKYSDKLSKILLIKKLWLII